MDVVLSLVATVIMFAFSAIVLLRFALKRQPSSLFWGIGLFMFGVGTLAEAYLAVAWSDTLFRAWYLCGVILNAAWLGHGTLLLFARRPWLRYVTLGLVILSLVGLVAVFALTLNSAAFSPNLPISAQYKEILQKGAPVRMLTPIFNIYGSLFLIGGAVYSAYLFWRKRASPNRVVGNLLIAAGALVVASAGSVTRLFGGGSLPIAELTAAILMFAGYMVSSATAPAPSPTAQDTARPAP